MWTGQKIRIVYPTAVTASQLKFCTIKISASSQESKVSSAPLMHCSDVWLIALSGRRPSVRRMDGVAAGEWQQLGWGCLCGAYKSASSSSKRLRVIEEWAHSKMPASSCQASETQWLSTAANSQVRPRQGSATFTTQPAVWTRLTLRRTNLEPQNYFLTF